MDCIAYSTAPSPTGPWTYRGTVMPAQGNSFTNHAGIVDFQGNSYFFYQNAALPGGGGFTRSVAVEKFSYNADGTIPTINMTNTGAPQLGTLNPYVRQEAETIAWGSGIETEWTSDGGMNVGWIENGDYIKVKGAAFGSGAASFTARGASATSGGTVELRLGSPSGTVVGRCSVPNTGGWQAWTTVTCPRLCQHLPRLLRQLEPGTPATLHTALTARRLHLPPHRPRMHPRQLRPRPHMRRRHTTSRIQLKQSPHQHRPRHRDQALKLPLPHPALPATHPGPRLHRDRRARLLRDGGRRPGRAGNAAGLLRLDRRHAAERRQ